MEEIFKELDGLDELVYLSDLDTYELLYINRCGMRQFQIKDRHHLAGCKCYKVLQGREEPCSFCTNHLLYEKQFYEWEIFNEITGASIF